VHNQQGAVKPCALPPIFWGQVGKRFFFIFFKLFIIVGFNPTEKEKIMFINVSNHNSKKWTPTQVMAAGEEIIDIQFPAIDPELDESGLWEFAIAWFKQTLAPILPRDGGGMLARGITVHLMGETGFCALLQKILGPRIRIVHSTTIREVVEHQDGSKTAQFRFVRFRETGFVPDGRRGNVV